MTYADNAEALGTSRNRPIEAAVTPPPIAPIATTLLPPFRRHTITLRVYDYCPEHGPHTDPELDRHRRHA